MKLDRMTKLPIQSQPSEKKESILEEAQRIVHGPREEAYDHPAQNFKRTAEILNALFEVPRPFEAEDIGLIMIAVKLARQAHHSSRDNLVDIAGYAETISRIEEDR